MSKKLDGSWKEFEESLDDSLKDLTKSNNKLYDKLDELISLLRTQNEFQRRVTGV